MSCLTDTNALTVALAQVANGSVATVAPDILSETLPLPGVSCLPLTEPAAQTPVGIVFHHSDPASPVLDLLLRIAREIVR